MNVALCDSVFDIHLFDVFLNKSSDLIQYMTIARLSRDGVIDYSSLSWILPTILTLVIVISWNVHVILHVEVHSDVGC